MSTAPDLETYRRQARAWLEANLQPRDRQGPVRGRHADFNSMEDLVPERALQKEVHTAGYAGISWPKEYGGQGLAPEYARVFAEESSFFRMPNLGPAGGTTFGACAQTMLRHGSPEFLSRHIPRILDGDELFVQLFSEPGAGSDLAGITTRAVKDGDRWVITGSKIWTTGAYFADYGMCLARTSWDVPKHRGLTWFAVPLGSKGVTVLPIREISGDSEFCQEFLDEVEVPADDVIGEVNQGWAVAQSMLVVERSSGRDDPSHLPAVDSGFDPALVRLVESVGRTSDPVARQLMARIHVNDWVRVKFAERVAGLMKTSDKPPAGIASYWKLAAGLHDPAKSRMIMELGRGASLVWGDGDEAGSRPAIDYLNSRIWSIAGGSNEMQRNAISERVLDLPREPSFDSDRSFSEVLRDAHNWSGQRRD